MRRFLHVSVEEANRMPWWQWRIYVEGLNDELSGAEDSGGAGMAGGEVGGDAASLAGLGFTVTGG